MRNEICLLAEFVWIASTCHRNCKNFFPLFVTMFGGLFFLCPVLYGGLAASVLPQITMVTISRAVSHSSVPMRRSTYNMCRCLPGHMCVRELSPGREQKECCVGEEGKPLFSFLHYDMTINPAAFGNDGACFSSPVCVSWFSHTACTQLPSIVYICHMLWQTAVPAFCSHCNLYLLLLYNQ